MDNNVFDKLREAILQPGPPSANAPSPAALDAEAERLRKAMRLQFFRSNVYPNFKTYLLAAFKLQTDKIHAAHMEQYISISYPVSGAPETRYGFPLPLHLQTMPQSHMEQALLSFALPHKPVRHMLVAFSINPDESVISVSIRPFDELARTLHDLPGKDLPVDSRSEFKEGEFFRLVQDAVNNAVEICVQHVAQM